MCILNVCVAFSAVYPCVLPTYYSCVCVPSIYYVLSHHMYSFLCLYVALLCISIYMLLSMSCVYYSGLSSSWPPDMPGRPHPLPSPTPTPPPPWDPTPTPTTPPPHTPPTRDTYPGERQPAGRAWAGVVAHDVNSGQAEDPHTPPPHTHATTPHPPTATTHPFPHPTHYTYPPAHTPPTLLPPPTVALRDEHFMATLGVRLTTSVLRLGAFATRLWIAN